MSSMFFVVCFSTELPLSSKSDSHLVFNIDAKFELHLR